MKEVIFRTLALVLSLGSLIAFIFFDFTLAESYTDYILFGFITMLFLAYGVGGNKLASNLLFFKDFTKS